MTDMICWLNEEKIPSKNVCKNYGFFWHMFLTMSQLGMQYNPAKTWVLKAKAGIYPGHVLVHGAVSSNLQTFCNVNQQIANCSHESADLWVHIQLPPSYLASLRGNKVLIMY